MFLQQYSGSVFQRNNSSLTQKYSNIYFKLIRMQVPLFAQQTPEIFTMQSGELVSKNVSQDKNALKYGVILAKVV